MCHINLFDSIQFLFNNTNKSSKLLHTQRNLLPNTMVTSYSLGAKACIRIPSQHYVPINAAKYMTNVPNAISIHLY